MDMNTTYSPFHLKVLQLAHKITLQIYKRSRAFPTYEQYGLTSQLQRASTSIGSNIVEGFGRRGQKEKTHFYNIAYSSSMEVRHQIHLAKDLEYLTSSTAKNLENELITLQKQLGALIHSINKKPPPSTTY